MTIKKENSENSNLNLCPNCENEFDKQFDFCPHCGQKNKKLQLRFRHFFNDFISSAFNLDSKIFLTLQLLIFYPGELPKLFLAGKRTKYIPPVRLYLIISLVYFTLLSFVGGDFVKWTENDKDEVVHVDSIKVNEVELADTSSSSQFEDMPIGNITVTLDSLNKHDSTIDRSAETSEIKNENTILDRAIENTAQKLATEEGKSVFQNTMRKYTSIGMFVLMPITALIFFLLFFKETYYIQHLVFVLYLQSMMFILFIVLNLVEIFIRHEFMKIVTIILFLFVLLVWIKKFYNFGWWKTTWKTLLFLSLFGICLILFFIIVMGVSAWNL